MCVGQVHELTIDFDLSAETDIQFVVAKICHFDIRCAVDVGFHYCKNYQFSTDMKFQRFFEFQKTLKTYQNQPDNTFVVDAQNHKLKL